MEHVESMGVVPETHRTFLSEVTAETLALKLESACHIMIDSISRRKRDRKTSDRESWEEDNVFSTKTRDRLAEFARDLARRFAKRCDMRARVLSLRILVTPPNAPSQDWHLDFRANNGDDLQCRTIFVALTDATIDNCTEFFVTRPSVEDRVEKAVRARKRDLRGGPGTLCSPSQRTRSEMNLDTKSADKHSTSPIVVKVKSSEIVSGVRSLRMRRNEIVCVNTSRLPHRRGASLASSDTRIVLNVDFTMVPEDRVLCDRPPSKIFVDDDWYASLSKCGVVPRAITDNLHSEVILRVI